MSFYLKSTSVGFPVVAHILSTQGQETIFRLKLSGQETKLPLILVWRSAVFPVPLSISFSPPSFDAPQVDAALIGTSLVQARETT